MNDGHNRGTPAGEKPRGYTTTRAFDDSVAPTLRKGHDTAPTKRNGTGIQLTDTGKGKINLRRVADVLEEHGLDPTVELTNVLKGGKLDDKTKAMICLELIQYQQPKLKAVENTHKHELTSDQVDRRLSQLIFKAQNGGFDPTVASGEAGAGGAVGTVVTVPEAKLAADVPAVPEADGVPRGGPVVPGEDANRW